MSVKFTPREYQAIGLKHLLSTPRCALWAGMGMGKTVTVLNTVDALIMAGEDKPVLVTAPLRVAKDTWTDEAAKWSHLRNIEVQPVLGAPDQRRRALKNPNASVFTINYEQLPWLVKHFGNDWPFATIVSDESDKLKGFRGGFRRHAKTGKVYYQGAGGQRSRALGRVAHTKAKRFIELTGTPTPNSLIDLWGQVWFLDAGVRLGRTFESFVTRWFTSGFDGYSLNPTEAAPREITERVKDLCLTLDPDDWFDLEKPVITPVYVNLPDDVRDTYDKMERKYFAWVENNAVEALNAAVKSGKCMQIASGAVYTDDEKNWSELHAVKIDALDSIIAEAGGESVLIAYWFKPDLVRLKKAFPKGVDLATDDGLHAFKTGRATIGFGQPQSIGHGIDGLQYVCRTIAYFTPIWSLGLTQQIMDRIGPVRQEQAGFKRAVKVFYILARDTVDELVMERQESKRSVQDIVKDACNRRKRGRSK